MDQIPIPSGLPPQGMLFLRNGFMDKTKDNKSKEQVFY